MKKLILIAMLSFSTAFACNDNMVFYGNKIGCELNEKERYASIEDEGEMFYSSSSSEVKYSVITKGGIIHTMRAERPNYTQINVTAHYMMFSEDYGQPIELDDKLIWFPDSDERNVLAMFIKGNSLVVLYSKRS